MLTYITVSYVYYSLGPVAEQSKAAYALIPLGRGLAPADTNLSRVEALNKLVTLNCVHIV